LGALADFLEGVLAIFLKEEKEKRGMKGLGSGTKKEVGKRE